MERRLPQVEADIQSWTQARDEAIEIIADANTHLLELGSERNVILGKVASRHLHSVPNVIPFPRRTPDYPDGAA